jgi:hypothetical protein
MRLLGRDRSAFDSLENMDGEARHCEESSMNLSGYARAIQKDGRGEDASR